MKPTLTLTQGLPGSGKSTWAREEAARTGAVLLGLSDEQPSP
jgi:predicted kinase